MSISLRNLETLELVDLSEGKNLIKFNSVTEDEFKLILDNIETSIRLFKKSGYLDTCLSENFSLVFDTSDPSFSSSECESVLRSAYVFNRPLDDKNTLKFVIDTFRYVSNTEYEFYERSKKKKDGRLYYEDVYGDLIFSYKLDISKLEKYVEVRYKGRDILKYVDYMRYGIKIVEHIDRFLLFSYNLNYDENSSMNIITWVKELEKFLSEELD